MGKTILLCALPEGRYRQKCPLFVLIGGTLTLTGVISQYGVSWEFSVTPNPRFADCTPMWIPWPAFIRTDPAQPARFPDRDFAGTLILGTHRIGRHNINGGAPQLACVRVAPTKRPRLV